MIKFFKNLFTEKAHVPNNSYRDTVPKCDQNDSQVIHYPIAAPTEEVIFSEGVAIEKVPSDGKIASRVAASLQPDFKNLVAKSKLEGQQRQWHEKFQRNTNDMLKKYIVSISEFVKENKDLESVFTNLNNDLKESKTPRAPFLKKLVLGLAENKTPFSDSLKAYLQSSSVASTIESSASNINAVRISKERTYCLGSKENKSRA